MHSFEKNLEKTSFKESKLDASFISNLQSISSPFIARADYISAEFIKQHPHEIDIKYLNYVRLVVEVPFIEGSFPLISTKSLHNYRLLLAPESDHSAQHICSNFIGEYQEPFIKYGFLKNHIDKPMSKYEQLSQKYRNR